MGKLILTMTQVKITGSKALWTRTTSTFGVFSEVLNMTPRKKELHMTTVDGSHVAVLEMNVPNDAFCYYEVQGDERLALEIAPIMRGVKSLKKPDDTATMEYDSDGKTTSEGNPIISWKSRFQDATTCPLDASAVNDPRIPLLDWEDKPECTVPTDWLLDALLTGKEYGEIATFAVSRLGEDKELWFSVSVYNERGTGTTVKYPLGTEEGHTDEGDYHLGFLIPFIRKVKASKCKETTMQFERRYPILLTNEWDDGTSSKMFLAPRVLNEDKRPNGP